MKFFRILACVILFASGLAFAQAPDTAEHRFDVHVEDAPARAFFQGLVEGTQYNILVPPDITGRVSLSLRRVTIEEVLGATRDLYGYDYKRISAGYMILPISLQTRVFHLNYLDLHRVGVSLTQVRSGQIMKTSKDEDQGSSGGGGSQGGDNGSAHVSAATGSAVFTKTESDFWTELAANLKAIIGDDPKHSVVINRQSGVIVLRAMPRELRDAEEYLRKTESTIARQVILEAKIIEVELNDAYQAGINWATLLKNGNQQYFVGQANPPAGWDTNLLNPANQLVTVQPGGPIPVNGLVTNALGGALSLAANFADFSTFIQLLGAQGNTHVLSSPRVSTLHNQKAVFKAGHDEFFVTNVTSNTVTGTSSSTSRDIELSPFFSGVSLDVTPEIGDDGNIILHVHPTVSDVTDQVKSLTISGETDVLPLANSQVRESDNIVKTRSGQVVLILVIII
jgi:MSHA biogenesis protein MshL